VLTGDFLYSSAKHRAPGGIILNARFAAILSLSVAVPMFALGACDETMDSTPAPKDSGTATTDSTTPASDAGGDGATTTLFQRLGGETGIAGFVDKVLAAEGADPEIASYMAPNMLTPPPAGKPSMAQIRECLIKQFAAAAGGPGIVYPTTVSGSFQCRDMASAHTSLHIGSGLFDKFVAIAGSVAATALSKEDLATVGGFLQLQKSAIVDPTAPDGGYFIFDSGADTNSTDAGNDAPVDAPEDG
jgi:hypothetical protein